MNIYLKVSEIDFNKVARDPENFRDAVANVMKTLSKGDELREFPTIYFHNGSPVLLDGFARAKVFDLLGIKYIPCKIAEPKAIKTEEGRDTNWCGFCDKETEQYYYYSGHERDSSGDYRKCLVCQSYKFGMKDKWIPATVVDEMS